MKKDSGKSLEVGFGGVNFAVAFGGGFFRGGFLGALRLCIRRPLLAVGEFFERMLFKIADLAARCFGAVRRSGRAIGRERKRAEGIRRYNFRRTYPTESLILAQDER
jgi:hypothetical protein